MSTEEAPIEPRIIHLRGRRIVLDADLARLYGVTTGRFNEAFKRNRRRFPSEFAFQLTAAEFAGLRTRGAMQAADLSEESRNLSQIATGSQRHRDPRLRPWAFTEHGAIMAANVLRSDRAIEMSVFVIRAFVRLREQVGANNAILKRLAEIDAILLRHDSALRDLYQKILPLLQPPADPPKRRIGFHSD